MHTVIIAAIPGDGEALKQTITQQGGTIAFEGTYEIQTPPQDAEEITIHYAEDDEIPLILLDENGNWCRELHGKEVDAISDAGCVTNVKLVHPRGDRYGLPISAANVPELWMGLAGNLGFKPSQNITLDAKDSEDDTPGHYVLTILVPKSLADKLTAITEATRQAAIDRLLIEETDHEEDTAVLRIQEILNQHAKKTDEELESEAAELIKTFQDQGGRGITLADSIDEIEALQEMRKTLQKEVETHLAGN